MNVIVWLRRDLRVRDNAALAAAVRAKARVCVAFVLDPVLLRGERVGAPIVQAFFDALGALRSELRECGSDLALLEGECAEELAALAKRIDASELHYNEDYEPSALERDARVARELSERGIMVTSHLDHVYFGAEEVLTDAGTPYKVFTPYKRRWLDQMHLAPRAPIASARGLDDALLARSAIGTTRDVPAPEDYGHRSSRAYPACSSAAAYDLLERFLDGGAGERYAHDRDVPALDGTSRLSVQLRAGTIGIRTCVAAAVKHGFDVWLSELIWRDFYQMILRQFPHVASGPFDERGKRVRWRDDDAAFDAWCGGRTGYPIVDAAMRQLNTTGWMHNRLRMIVASFLTKDLLVTWQRGERYFEQHLADADLAQNNGGWQWASSTGTDAAPYFRVFNPELQSKKFDPDGAFIRAMIPELARVPDSYVHAPWTMPPLLQEECRCRIGVEYPEPIVDHSAARTRALAAYTAMGERTR